MERCLFTKATVRRAGLKIDVHLYVELRVFFVHFFKIYLLCLCMRRYGRMALGPQEEFEKEEASDTKKGSKQDEKEKGAEAEEGENDDAATAKAAASPPSKPTKVAGTGGALSGKAFQRLEFLVGGRCCHDQTINQQSIQLPCFIILAFLFILGKKL